MLSVLLVFAVISDCGLSFERVSLQMLLVFAVISFPVYYCNMFLVFVVIRVSGY